MRAIILIISILALFFSGCKTSDAGDYFGESLLGDNWSASSFAAYLKNFSEKPLEQQNLKGGETLYRLLVLQAGSPVHMIKIRTEHNGSTTVSIKSTKRGYMIRSGKKIDNSYILKPSNLEVSKFLNEISKYNFWLQGEAPQYDFTDEIQTHPPMFLIEGRSEDANVAFFDYDPRMRKNTASLILAFYKLADVDDNDEWALTKYFRQFAEVDWVFEN